MNSIFLLLIIVLIINQQHYVTYAQTANDAATGPDVINKACSKSSDKNLCLSVFNSNGDSQNSNLKSLAFIALKAAAVNATELSAQIKMSMDDKTLETPVSDSLSTCSQQYLDVVDQIEDSVNALVSDAYNDVETWLRAAIDDIKTCDDLVRGQGGKAGEVSSRNQVVSQLCTNALSVLQVVLQK
ncbi:probable pectinesterase/pectinesterase inhibitor 61 [Impatiens glandulifera]|uniref:probable pectinesterase/pectinesterase inhibitor 61 n=1 Tax=Impatiens glandulifera TaxID=253017 RepID=UPI001FB10E93|nr:probable pectinesterase/pectinesterase inhibitor 61 [Impatiens glandulifera]